MSEIIKQTSSADEKEVTYPSIPRVENDDTTTVSTGINDYLGSDSYYYNPMPLLKYSRISGLLEAGGDNEEDARSSPCTSSAISQVLLDPSTIMESPEVIANSTSASSTDTPIDQEYIQSLLHSDLWKQPHLVMALGFEDSHVSIVSACNGHSLLSDTKLTIREDSQSSNDPVPVIDVHMDATGSILAAIDAEASCAIWEVKYSLGLRHFQQQQQQMQDSNPTSTTNDQDSRGGGNVLSNMFSSLMGIPPRSSEEDTQPGEESDDAQPSSSLQLMASATQPFRIKYPTNFGSPTCLVIDPAYKRQKEKKIITGFRDGRLMMTGRGGLFQRRNDTVLYEGAPDSTSQTESYRGIECIAWRGSFIAWADASGIKVMDVETLTKIAHVDRPTGARPTLYPNISSLQPTLLFETSHEVLVGWGDCLMGITVKESSVPGSDTKKRSVECSMAWELDCVACGVSPLDKDHVVVLGLVPFEDDDEDDGEDKDQQNDIELQILSRKDGTVLYSDLLPIEKPELQSPIPGLMAESASAYKLLSSFALPRMTNALELEELKIHNGGMEDDFDVQALFGAAVGKNSNKDFCDLHLQWNVKSILFDEETDYNAGDEDESSVDSDDYGFIFRPAKDSDLDGIAMNDIVSLPPSMVIVSPNDVVLAKTATIDDAITHALSKNQNALALNRGLQHRRQLRSYRVGDLTDHYLEALLKLHERQEPSDDSDLSGPKAGRSLSLRRMHLAVKSMPYLLGHRVEAWTKWTKELETIPGSIFLLREYLPVRDPVLPQVLYEQVLQKMLSQLGTLLENPSDNETNVGQEAVDHYLDTLLAWGPTRTLKEYVRLYKYSREQHPTDKAIQRKLRLVEVSLQRRYLQTAAEYLNFPVDGKKIEGESSSALRFDVHRDDSRDSLFAVENILKVVAPRAPIVSIPEDFAEDSEKPTNVELNDLVSLKSMARLRMMQNRYDLALKCYLTIGLYHSTNLIEELETKAVDFVNYPTSESTPACSETSEYEFVLGMIENHHLHQLLVDEGFMTTESNSTLPLFALLKLVGLDLIGQFLINHCVSPEFALFVDGESKESTQREVLPMDLVARQLDRSPALLHWYLHLVFREKPELYVKFPSNYIPPKAVTDLHRRHFELFVEFAGGNKKSVKSFSAADTYEAEARTTPLLSFLKAVLPIGGLSPVDARRTLEMQRSKEFDEDGEAGELIVEGHSSYFSLELAYIIENYGDETEAEAFGVLDLYLEGVKSLMLAVSYAQRQKTHSKSVWDRLINYCISNQNEFAGDGSLFGALLEASASCGADLARLVARIPPGMNVEGLRPRLVAAVADYRMKLDIHEAASEAAEGEKVALLREVAHRSRRGVRYQFPVFEGKFDSPNEANESDGGILQTQISELRTKVRRDRHSLSYSIPIR